jgi:hypothetical protein
MYHRNRLTLNEFENKLWPFPLGIADYPAGPAMDASRYQIVQLHDLSVEGSADDTWPLVVRRCPQSMESREQGAVMPWNDRIPGSR